MGGIFRPRPHHVGPAPHPQRAVVRFVWFVIPIEPETGTGNACRMYWSTHVSNEATFDLGTNITSIGCTRTFWAKSLPLIAFVKSTEKIWLLLSGRVRRTIISFCLAVFMKPPA